MLFLAVALFALSLIETPSNTLKDAVSRVAADKPPLTITGDRTVARKFYLGMPVNAKSKNS